jgi:hypothetical protein
MPLSVVAYTSHESFAGLAAQLKKRFEDRKIKPYTLSFPHKQATGDVRFRATELAPGALMPLLADMVEKKAATLASPADREIRRAAYGEILRDADRSRRTLTVQYATPVMVPVMGNLLPFPIVPAVFAGYGEAWDAFSDVVLPRPAVEAAAFVRVADFKISCAATPFGTGGQGWVTLEMEKGRTEEEIGLLNALVDFAFYCGTGVHTEEGLGQTRKIDPRRPSINRR